MLSINCLVHTAPSDHGFRVNACDEWEVIDLKRAICKEVQKGWVAHEITLWQVSIPANVDGFDVTVRNLELKENEGVKKLNALLSLSDYYQSPPLPKHLHIIVEPPKEVGELSYSRKRVHSDEDAVTSGSANSKRTMLENVERVTVGIRKQSNVNIKQSQVVGSRPSRISEKYCLREDTVNNIYEKLKEYSLIQVRATPGSGKTTLMALLDARIRRSEPDAFVRRVTYWSREYMENFPDPLERMQVYVHNDYPEGKRPGVHNYILFDDAQDTYWDEWLWNVVFKHIGDGSTPYYVVLFCSYGSPGPRPLDYKCGAPLRLRPSARISLRPQDTDDGIGPAGVLLSHAEYDDVVNRFAGPVVLDDELRSLIFDWTAGYAGAVSDILKLVAKGLQERSTFGVADLFKICSLQCLPERLVATSRGFPDFRDLRKPELAKVLKRLIKSCPLVANELDEADQEAISVCHRKGWVISVSVNDYDHYALPSPLHFAVLSWRLMSSHNAPRSNTVFDMCMAIIRNFRPSQLLTPNRVSYAFLEEPNGVQYQNEFHRAHDAESEGSMWITPEFASAQGAKTGRVDFFVPAKKWGIELAKEGNELEEHGSRFGPNGAYGRWMLSSDMSDYIILDFRQSIPQKAHSGIQKLYHIVFNKDFSVVTVLDNMLKKLDEFSLHEH